MNDQVSAQAWAANRLQLAGFVLDLAAGELLTADLQLAGLRKQALDVLLVLGRSAGQVVGKDELMRIVWPDVVVGEGSLTQAIADIRRVLGDSEHRLVRNVARRGYVLMPDPAAGRAPPPSSPLIVDAGGSAPALVGGAPSAVDARGSTPAPVGAAPSAAGGPATGGRSRERWLWVVAVLALIVGAGVWVVQGGTALSGKAVPAPAKAPLPRELPALSIVVLPLAIEGDAQDSEWFADALLLDLTTEVARLSGSFVIARDTAHTYKGRTPDPRDVARELGVRYVVRGSLRRDGTVIRLHLALIDGDNGVQRWAEKFVFERAQLGQALDDFVLQLARALSIEVSRSAADRSAALSPAQVSADDLAMRAFALWFRGFNRENLNEALGLLEQAVARDPDSMRGWAGLTFMNLQAGSNGWVPDRAAAFRRIDDAALHLDRLDPDGFYTYQAKVIQAFLRKEWPAMLRSSEAWVKHHHHPVALGGYGSALMLNGRPEEGIAPLERALRLSPRDSFRAEWQYRLALIYFILGRYEQARDWGQTAQAANPALPWPPVHAAALVRLGHKAEAKQVFDDFMLRNPRFETGYIAQRLFGTDARYVDGRDRLIASLREVGLR